MMIFVTGEQLRRLLQLQVLPALSRLRVDLLHLHRRRRLQVLHLVLVRFVETTVSE